MANLVFAISRTHGSGGRIIGSKIAEKLGIHYYDKELIDLAVDDSGISENLFGLADERKPSVLKTKDVYTGEIYPPNSSEFTSDKNLFNYQAKIIKNVAQKESCVIVGRCADFILRDNADINLVKVFIHAPVSSCIDTLTNHYSSPKDVAAKRIEKIDRDRAEYYKYYTGNDWENVGNYDIVLDSSVLGFDKTAQAIVDYAKLRFDIK